jgi:hypothetical protein
MATNRPGQLLGRSSEREVLDQVLADVRSGNSRVLGVRGEPGVGKTALLTYTTASARGFRIVQAAGVESEMELPFAALQRALAVSARHRDDIRR